MPDGNAVAPPELPRDAPVANVVEPVQQDGSLVVGHDLNQVFAHHFFRGLRQRIHLAEPLRGNARLDFGFAAVADAHGVRDVLDFFEQAQLLQIFDDARARNEAVKSGVLARGLAHMRVVGHHVDFGQVVALADFEVIGIVRGRDLHHAGAEFAVHVGIRDHGNFAVHERKQYVFADQRLIALVVRMHGHGSIAEHRFRPRGGDNQISSAACGRAHDRIANVPELAGPLDVHHFQVADGRLAARAPVDHVAAAIDQPLAVEPQKRLEYRAIERRFECELLACPIAGRAQPDHLLLDDAAALRLPLPHAPLEFLAAEVLPADFFLRQLALHHKLRGDAGMVHAGEPERVVAAHAVPADQHVDLRVLEHVADVDGAGDIGRRQCDRKHRPVARIFGAKQLLVEPGLGPALFDLLRLIRLGYFSRHSSPVSIEFRCEAEQLILSDISNISGDCGRRQIPSA